jgi:hypothetical protein
MRKTNQVGIPAPNVQDAHATLCRLSNKLTIPQSPAGGLFAGRHFLTHVSNSRIMTCVIDFDPRENLRPIGREYAAGLRPLSGIVRSPWGTTPKLRQSRAPE